MIVGLSGYARSGKDTFGGLLVQHHDFDRVAFADKLKDTLYDLDPDTWVELEDDTPVFTDSLRAVVDGYGWEWAKEHTGCRALLQRLGVSVREHIGENTWVDAALQDVDPVARTVITDVRFPNEADAIRERGGVLVRIRRPQTGAVNAHVSETALDGYRFDYVIENSGTIDNLRTAAQALVTAEAVNW